MLRIQPIPDKAKSVRLCEAFLRGAPRRAAGLVFYGLDRSSAPLWHQARVDRYYIDNAYFDATRGQRFRVTKNRLQVRPADWTSDGARFESLGLAISPWRRVTHGHFLAVEQSAAFDYAAPGHREWLTEAVECLGDVPIRWRRWSRDKPGAALSLPDALEGARCVVTHTSAAAVQAVLAGVHCIVSEQHALHRMTCSQDPTVDQRRHFLSVLADHEFTPTEMENGTAWRQLNP